MGTQDEKKLESCQLCNRQHDLDECKAFNDMVVAREASVWQNRNCVKVAMEVFQQNAQHVTVQKEEHVRSALRSIPLAYMVSSTKTKMGQ